MSYHIAIKTSPFEALYSHPPHHFGITNTTVCQSLELATWLEQRAFMQNVLKQHLERAREIMKNQADQHHNDR
jgi:hypothetical protein